MEKLKFYDLRAREPFYSDEYQIRVKNGRRFAIAKSPKGTEAWRILGMA